VASLFVSDDERLMKERLAMAQRISTGTCSCVLSVTVFLCGVLFADLERGALAEETAETEGSVLSLGTKLNLSLSGYVEASYTQNFNNPKDGVNQHRSFDGDANSFRPNMAQIVLERAAKTQGSWKERTGFRVKLNVGEDAKFTGGDGGDEEFDFQETYLQFVAPIGNGITLQAGRMNTLIGYEVIESPLNPNFSRSFLFGMGEPFTVTGVRASYDFTDQVSFAVSAINSFTGSQVDENNSKSVEALLAYTPMDNVSVSLFGFWGPEGERNTSDETDRVLVGGILDVQVTDQAEVVLEGYYGNRANNTRGMNARWNGLAGYVMYDFTDSWGLRVRTEVFEDAAGAFACDGSGGAAGNALHCAEGWEVRYDDNGEQTLWETTWTLQYRPVQDFIARLEYRYDKSNKGSFWDGSVYGNNQSTLAVEAIYLF